MWDPLNWDKWTWRDVICAWCTNNTRWAVMSFMRVLYVPVYFTKYISFVNVLLFSVTTIICFKVLLICSTCNSLSTTQLAKMEWQLTKRKTTLLSLWTFCLSVKLWKMSNDDLWINVCINSLKLAIASFICKHWR